MKTNDKQRLIPEGIFAKAFCTHFKCKPKDIEIRMIDDNQEAFVIYQTFGYKISTEDVFRQDIEFALTDYNAANYIHFSSWIATIRNTVEISKIIDRLIGNIRDLEDARILLVAIQLGSYAEDPDIAFWKVLSRIDITGELVGWAIVETAKIYNGPGLINDLTQHQIINGISVYNQVEGGIFESIILNEEINYPTFYIYSSNYDL